MSYDVGEAEAGRRYAEAYAVHYTDKDLAAALKLYRDIVTGHPKTREAGYSRSQIRNIAEAVIPAQELYDVQLELVLAHFDGGDLEGEADAGEGSR